MRAAQTRSSINRGVPNPGQIGSNAHPGISRCAVAYLRGAEESALLWRTTVGARRWSRRRLLDLGARHRDAVGELLERGGGRCRGGQNPPRDSWVFYAEIIAHIEMCLRGYRPSIESLRTLEVTLEDRCDYQTRDLEGSLKELKRDRRARRRLLLEKVMRGQEDERRRIAGRHPRRLHPR